MTEAAEAGAKILLLPEAEPPPRPVETEAGLSLRPETEADPPLRPEVQHGQMARDHIP